MKHKYQIGQRVKLWAHYDGTTAEFGTIIGLTNDPGCMSGQCSGAPHENPTYKIRWDDGVVEETQYDDEFKPIGITKHARK